MSHKPGGRLPILSARTAVTPATLRVSRCGDITWGVKLRGLLPILLLGEQRHNGCEQFAYLRLLPDSVATVI